MTYYKVLITDRNDQEDHHFESLDKVKEFLTERYGKLPNTKGKKKLYASSAPADKGLILSPELVKSAGGPTKAHTVIGFALSYRKKVCKACNPKDKATWQTDWICIREVTEKTVLI